MVAAVGMVAALNAHFGAHASLPEEGFFNGHYAEALGDPGLDPGVEAFLRSIAH